MDLALATVEQIAAELRKRSLNFVLVLTPEIGEQQPPEEAEYRVHSSFTDSSDETSLQDGVQCLLASLTVIATLGEALEDVDDPKAEDFWRWKSTGDTLVRDIFATAQEWSDEQDSDGEQ
jgi:hypothetical protein